MQIHRMFELAAKVALPTSDISERRAFWLGAVGIRKDQTVVRSKNGASIVYDDSDEEYQLNPLSHAEGRVLRKLGHGGTVFVARVAKMDGSWRMSRPCQMCQTRLKAFSVKKVFYTINDEQYGIWSPRADTDVVFSY